MELFTARIAAVAATDRAPINVEAVVLAGTAMDSPTPCSRAGKRIITGVATPEPRLNAAAELAAAVVGP